MMGGSSKGSYYDDYYYDNDYDYGYHGHSLPGTYVGGHSHGGHSHGGSYGYQGYYGYGDNCCETATVCPGDAGYGGGGGGYGSHSHGGGGHSHGYGGGGYGGSHSHGGGHSHGGHSLPGTDLSYGGYYGNGHSHGGGHSHGDSGSSSSSSSGKGKGKGGMMGSSSSGKGKGKGGMMMGSSSRRELHDTYYGGCYTTCVRYCSGNNDGYDDDGYGDDGYDDDHSDDGHSTPYDKVSNYVIDFAVDIGGDKSDTLQNIEDFLNHHVAGYIENKRFSSNSGGSVDIANVEFHVSEDRDSCTYTTIFLFISLNGMNQFFGSNPIAFSFQTAHSYCPTCTNVDVLAHVYYSGSDDPDLVGSVLYDAFMKYCEEFLEIEGVRNTYDPCPSIQVSYVHPPGTTFPGSDDDDDGGGAVVPIVVESRSTEPSGIGAGAISGIVLAALALLALLAFLALRRRRNRHDDNNKVPINDTLLDDSAQVEDDSRFGMYPEGQSEGMILGNRSLYQDVHKCSSATCKLCERKRNGLQFLPTRPAPIPEQAGPDDEDEEGDEDSLLKL